MNSFQYFHTELFSKGDKYTCSLKMAATTQPSYWHFKIFLFRLPGRDKIKLCVDFLLQTIHITCRYLLSLYIYIIWASKNLDTPTFLTQTTEVSYGWHINDFFFFFGFLQIRNKSFFSPTNKLFKRGVS